MKKLNILLMILMIGVVAAAGLELSRNDTVIPRDAGADREMSDARLNITETGEVKCEIDSCRMRIWFTESGRSGTDMVGLKDVDSSSTDRNIEEARIPALRKWASKKSALLIEANVIRDARGTPTTRVGPGDVRIDSR